jgi:threonine synthase
MKNNFWRRTAHMRPRARPPDFIFAQRGFYFKSSGEVCIMAYRGLIEQYRQYLPVNEKTPVVTLHEGNTPLIPAMNLGKKIGFDGEIYFI